MTLGEKIASFRKEKGWSQEELAARLFVTRQAVSKWERDLSIPELDTLKRLASEMGVSLASLLSSNEDHLEEERPLGFTDFRLTAVYLGMVAIVLAVGSGLALLPEAREELPLMAMAFVVLGLLFLEIIYLLVKTALPFKKVRLLYSNEGLRVFTWRGEKEIPFTSIRKVAAKTHGNWRLGKLVIETDEQIYVVESIRNVNDVKTIVDELLFSAKN